MDFESVFLLSIVCSITLVLIVLRQKLPPPVFFNIDEIRPSLSILQEPTNVLSIQTELSRATEKIAWQKWAETELYPIGPDGIPSWDIIPIYAFGHWIPQYQPLFPELTNLLKSVGGIRTALFSRMKGYTSIKPHQGWATLANSVIRCHLGINVPGKSFVSVDGFRQYHQEGKLLLFDDSHLHYAANLSPDERTVLLVDVIRPVNLPKGISNVETSERLLDIVQQYLPGVKLK